jgi:hypothetical protein
LEVTRSHIELMPVLGRPKSQKELEEDASLFGDSLRRQEGRFLVFPMMDNDISP